MTEELSKGFTGIEINGVRFSNIKEMLSYMNKQRVRIIDLNAQLTKAKEIIKKFLDAKNIEDTCVAESEAEHFLQELSELQTVSIDWSEI